jgi:DNA repair exonuclease SbcCD ATPase subunit
MTKGCNWIEMGLTTEEDQFVVATAKLYKVAYQDAFETAFKVGRAIRILQKRYYGSGIQGAFESALIQYGFTSRDGLSAIDKSIRSNLKELLEHEEEVRAWWMTVPDMFKREWLSISSIHRHWKAYTTKHRTKSNHHRDRPNILEQLAAAQLKIDALTERVAEVEQERDAYRDATQDAYAAEHQHQMQRAKQLNERLQGRIKELEQELQTAKSRIEEVAQERNQSMTRKLDEWHTFLTGDTH